MFFIAAALVLTTAGVFAGKAKFASFIPYASNSGVLGTGVNAQLTISTTAVQLQTTGTTQATITDQASNVYGLYYYDGSSTTLHRLYSTSAW